MRNILKILTLSAAAISVAGCAYGNMGGLGYNSGYGYNGYGNSPYGYGSPYFGWYNNSYYPGTGIYVYDAYRRPTVWNDAQRVYWTNQKRAYESATAKSGQKAPRISTNWTGFTRDRVQTRAAPTRVERERVAISNDRTPQRETRQAQRTARTERVKQRTERTERTRDRRGRNSDD